MKFPIFQVDAFTSHVFGGNPAAVIPLTKWLPDETMQQIAMENNLSETAFYVEEHEAFGLRWFTPEVEVDLCGHATLATAHVLFKELGFAGNELRFDTRSGRLTVAKANTGYTMNFPAVDMPQVEAPPILFQALGIKRTSKIYRTDDYMVVMESEAEVAALDPDFRFLKEVDARGIIVTAKGEKVDFVSRFFGPQVGIDEDPVTGSAHTKTTPYWASELGKTELTARQISKRVGDLIVRHLGDRVEIEGQAVTFLRGEIEV